VGGAARGTNRLMPGRKRVIKKKPCLKGGPEGGPGSATQAAHLVRGKKQMKDWRGLKRMMTTLLPRTIRRVTASGPRRIL
jgi:hypothetical protein